MGTSKKAQVAGIVYRNAKHADKCPPPEVVVKKQSHTDLTDYITQGFYDELQLLLMAAGFGGSFTVFTKKRVPGSPHTKGLRIGVPCNNGLAITWHDYKRGNDGNIELLLLPPHNMSAHTFKSKLTEAELALKNDDDLEEDLQRVLEGKPPLKRNTPQQIAEQSSVVPFVSKEASNDSSENAPFTKEDVELFFEFLFDKFEMDETGLVHRSHCTLILDQDFNIPPRGRGGKMKYLIGRKHLISVDEKMVRLPKARLKKYYLARAKKGEPQESVAKEVSAPVSSEPQEHPLQVKLDRLQRRAETVEAHEARLADITQQLEKIASLIADFQKSEKDLFEERDRIKSELGSPDLAHARERYAEILKILGD